jgi:TetR/AcrR family transcriptional regulator, regulator of cefoperazone and chloramphenicol sensitivity
MSTDDTRARIIQAAGEVFADRGYQAATIRDISRRAGANLAAVNYYFGDKEKLYIEVLKSAHPEGAELSPEEPWAAGASPEEKLRGYIRAFLERLLQAERPAWRMRLMQREILEPTPFCVEMMRSYIRAHFAQLMDVLDEVLPPETPAHRRHQIALSIVGQCVYFRAAAPVIAMVIDEEERETYHTVEHLTEHITQVVLAALGLRPPVGQEQSAHGVVLAPHGEHRATADASERDRAES